MKRNRLIIWIALLSLLLGAIAPVMAQEAFDAVTFTDNYLQNELPQGWGQVKVEDLAAQLIEQPPFLLDVREPAEVEELGYIPGAIS